ncbi:hypothetical protein L0222_22825 [bacterium]|nr:hypothetical protein [bacterium]MCI0606989.1 hypothetical protein [bacterium]
MFFNIGRIPTRRKFSSLSVKDLLDARDAYHIHLAHLENVIGTAIGKYRLKRDELDVGKDTRKWRMARSKSGSRSTRKKDFEPRRLSNTTVREHSWPCVLVFVEKLWEPGELWKYPYQAVPRELYLPDGRVVPTCVVLAPRALDEPLPADRFNFPSAFIGGGYSCYTTAQQVERVGSLGCLVSKEGSVYALTNRHVAGETDQDVYSLVGGDRIKIGTSSKFFVTKKNFEEAYPGWPGKKVFLTMDVALVKVNDLNQWTSQVFGMGEVGTMLDMDTSTITLDLIGCPVRAFGSISGPVEGTIHGFFYRYRTQAGIDYVSDILIGPRNPELNEELLPESAKKGAFPSVATRPGDSGTIWFIDPSARQPADTDDDDMKLDRSKLARKLRPIGIQWAGQKLLGTEPEKPTHFALATFLSTTCRELDIELVTDVNTGLSEYWGKIGHFKIGFQACQLLNNPNLRQLMQANSENIGFPDADLLQGTEFTVGREDFVPLADVPDYKWVKNNAPARQKEPIQHFADIDEAGPNGEASLLDRSANTNILNAVLWQSFYDLFDGREYGPEEGVLPFRVWQIYNAMLSYIRANDARRFVAAAGIMAHYVGDASQSLHSSILHHGYGPPFRRKDPRYEEYHDSKEYKIHSVYEAVMFERHPIQLINEINAQFAAGQAVQPVAVTQAGDKEGFRAARHLLNLMLRTYNRIPPRDIIAADDPTLNQPQRAALLFNRFHTETAQCIADSSQVLAELWESAWAEANGDQNIPQGDLVLIQEGVLTQICKEQNFIPAWTIDDFVANGF